MARATFEIKCEYPEIIMNSVKLDDASYVKYTAENDMLIIDIEGEDLKSLMKTSYSVCNRVQLAIETVSKFK